MNKKEAIEILEEVKGGFEDYYEVTKDNGTTVSIMSRYDKTPMGYDSARYLASRYSFVTQFTKEAFDCVIRHRQYDWTGQRVFEKDLAKYVGGKKVFEEAGVPPTFDEWFDSPEVVKEGEEWGDLVRRTNAFEDYEKFLKDLE